MRTTIESESKYVILKKEISEKEMIELYPGFKKTTMAEIYSSDKVEKISKNELKINIESLLGSQIN